MIFLSQKSKTKIQETFCINSSILIIGVQRKFRPKIIQLKKKLMWIYFNLNFNGMKLIKIYSNNIMISNLKFNKIISKIIILKINKSTINQLNWIFKNLTIAKPNFKNYKIKIAN